jgi:hypothetical protein
MYLGTTLRQLMQQFGREYHCVYADLSPVLWGAAGGWPIPHSQVSAAVGWRLLRRADLAMLLPAGTRGVTSKVRPLPCPATEDALHAR